MAALAAYLLLAMTAAKEHRWGRRIETCAEHGIWMETDVVRGFESHLLPQPEGLTWTTSLGGVNVMPFGEETKEVQSGALIVG